MGFCFTADDFGSSSETNHAIIKAHQAGTLHAASLMMGEAATQEAVALAKANPLLRVGLHVVVTDGKSVLPQDEIPDLVSADRWFPQSAAHTWLKYFFHPRLRAQLQKEIDAQFEAFLQTGLRLSHVDGHHHQHIHPLIFRRVIQLAKEHRAQWVRIPRENLKIWKLASETPNFLKWLHGLLYYVMTRKMREKLTREGFLAFDGVFGFLDTWHMSKEYVLKILEVNPPGNYEMYFHPGASWNHDLEILLDPAVINTLKKLEKTTEHPGSRDEVPSALAVGKAAQNKTIESQARSES